jgi:hypothetical protein
MRRCAFLTMDSLDGFVSDDALTYEPLHKLCWKVEEVPWRRTGTNWRQFDAVVIRSTWDYQSTPNLFLSVLEEIMQSGTPLHNSLDLVRWNLRKTYLAELSKRGVLIVPTVWGSNIGPVNEKTIQELLQTKEVIVKPVVSANADHTYWLTSGSPLWDQAAADFVDREYMAQPFMRSIIEEGEYSLLYFNGRLSHAILKTPKPQDFRVQEEHGGIIQPTEAPSALIPLGKQTMAAIGEEPLYARLDFVRLKNDDFRLMEAELIEPALYFRMDSKSPELFARALNERLR